jgi:uncharacterized protein with HEPN domain
VRDDQAYLRHIRDAIELIETYTARGRDAFLGEPMVRDAGLRNLEVIDEAVKNLSTEIRSRRPGVPWQRVSALRDVLIHEYFGVDLGLVWEIIEHRLPELKRDIVALLAED